MRRTLPPDRADERGAILVLSAVALTVIMALVALSVDLGNLAQAKQHARNAAEDAVLAGVVDLAPLGPGGGGNVATQEAAAVSDAESYLLDNYHIASPDWDSCGSFPAGISAYPGANCFGFFAAGGSAAPNGMAVQVPPQSVATTFGRAIGVRSEELGARAYASIETAQSSYVLPFAYSAGGGTGLQCLKTGSGNAAGGCTGFTTGSGKFGSIDSPRYVIFPGTGSSSGNNPTAQTDMVLGLDHPLDQDVAGATEVCDAAGPPPNCPAYNDVAPYTGGNYVAPATGQAASDLDGLFEPVTSPDGSCTFAPRLDHPDGFVATSSCSADQGAASGNPPNDTGLGVPLLSNDTFGSSYDLNGQQVSAFLDGNGEAFSTSCADLSPGVGTPIDAMSKGTYAWSAYDACLSGLLQSYDPSVSGPIFASSIESSPRFGIVPLVSSSSGKNAEAITGFEGVYLDLMFGKGGKVESLLAWVFPLGAIEGGSTTGQGTGGAYLGGQYVTNLCSYTSSGTNC